MYSEIRKDNLSRYQNFAIPMVMNSHADETVIPEVRERSGKIIDNKKEPRPPVKIGVSAILAFDIVCQEKFL